MVRRLSDSGVSFIQYHESCRLNAYLCPAGLWTIGWGHTGDDVREGISITQTVADQWLKLDISDACAIVEDSVTVPLNDNQFAALVSFVYNIGHGCRNKRNGFVVLKNGKPSSLLSAINRKDFADASTQFEKWVYINGIKSKGLMTRRRLEKALFNTRP